LYAGVASPVILNYGPLTSDPLVAGVRLARDLRTFRRHLRRHRPDFVCVVSALLPAALLAARRERIPTIVYAAEILERRFIRSLPRTLAARGLLRLTGRLANMIVACSRTVERQFYSVGAKTTTIYPGVGLEHGDGDRTRLRAEFGLAESDLCVAAVGNLNEGRAQDLLLRAMPSIKERAPGAHCLIAGAPLQYAGDRAYREHLVALVHELGLEESVHFLGFVTTIADVYAAADVVVNPARFNEPFGRVAMEALVAERPVVATRVGAIPEVLRDGIDALLVEPDDPSAIAGAVVRLWDERDLAERLVREGRSRVLAEFNERRGVEAFAHAVESVLAD
jgi:glycosyltransferase involved in cell wall biosynthesis